MSVITSNVFRVKIQSGASKSPRYRGSTASVQKDGLSLQQQWVNWGYATIIFIDRIFAFMTLLALSRLADVKILIPYTEMSSVSCGAISCYSKFLLQINKLWIKIKYIFILNDPEFKHRDECEKKTCRKFLHAVLYK